jgi:hypothetical protein
MLRPASLPRGQRFETEADAGRESERSEKLLRGSGLGIFLQECRVGHYHCEEPFCPRCARSFRRWFIAESLRLAGTQPGKAHMMTVLLETAPHDKIDSLNIGRHSEILRKRLVRSGLGETVVIGGFEVVYKARMRRWILHAHLALFGANADGLARFEENFATSDLDGPVKTVGLNDFPEQLSYTLKFCTYHRPYKQTGPERSPAKPLNRREHLALAQWMHQREFTEFLFLFNVRRYGARIRPRLS